MHAYHDTTATVCSKIWDCRQPHKYTSDDRYIYFDDLHFREVIRDNNDTHCGLNQRCAQLNVAVGGAVNTQMPGQAENLVEKLQNDPDIEGDIDYENDWKLITMFIGGNDLCRSCQNEVSSKKTSLHTII